MSRSLPGSLPAAPRLLGLLLLLLLGLLRVTSAHKESSSPAGTFQELRAALADMAGEGRAFLGRLAGEQTLLSVQKAFSKVLMLLGESLASALNVLIQYVSQLLQAAGITVGVPVGSVTPAGLLFVAQWLLVALCGYWLLALALRLLTSTLRRALWLLKLCLAVAGFALILGDYRVGTDTMAVRLAVLVAVCVLLGVGSSGPSGAQDKTARLEEQVKVLESRLRDMERWTRTDG